MGNSIRVDTDVSIQIIEAVYIRVDTDVSIQIIEAVYTY